jgi:hypothetical protein
MSLNLEITSITQRNTALQADNASLLQRWLDKMNLTAEEMNEEFEREAVAKLKPSDGGEAGLLNGEEEVGERVFQVGGKGR